MDSMATTTTSRAKDRKESQKEASLIQKERKEKEKGTLAHELPVLDTLDFKVLE